MTAEPDTATMNWILQHPQFFVVRQQGELLGRNRAAVICNSVTEAHLHAIRFQAIWHCAVAILAVRDNRAAVVETWEKRQ